MCFLIAILSFTGRAAAATTVRNKLLHALVRILRAPLNHPPTHRSCSSSFPTRHCCSGRKYVFLFFPFGKQNISLLFGFFFSCTHRVSRTPRKRACRKRQYAFSAGRTRTALLRKRVRNASATMRYLLHACVYTMLCARVHLPVYVQQPRWGRIIVIIKGFSDERFITEEIPRLNNALVPCVCVCTIKHVKQCVLRRYSCLHYIMRAR